MCLLELPRTELDFPILEMEGLTPVKGPSLYP